MEYNNENAIKRFAYYRENTVGVMTEKGLNDYLLLLSIYQSCRFKGISFFKFRPSRVLDVDEFSEGKRIGSGAETSSFTRGALLPLTLSGSSSFTTQFSKFPVLSQISLGKIIGIKSWCPWPESNQHSLRNLILKLSVSTSSATGALGT